MKQLELFAGIGGFGLAGHWAGIETVCQVEIDPFCQKVLQKNFPDAQRHDDIHTFDGSQWRGTVDVISGGFPCQPYSVAGKRLGAADERHLWPEMLRVVREVAPRWVVGENVGGIISWSNGLVFEQVCADLEAEGYEVQPFIFPACAVNAPHRRDRVWFVAHAMRSGQGNGYKHSKGGDVRQLAGRDSSPTTKDATFAGRAKLNSTAVTKGQEFVSRSTNRQWSDWTHEPAIYRMDDGIPHGLDKNRNARIKALGNAIVPQVAYQIFKAIVEYENLNQ